jgi:hypothetical protein
MVCPNCRQDAPTIVKGVRAYCTACGAPRSLLEDTPVNVAGQPSKIGGGVARVVGWIILLTGILISLTAGGLISMLSVQVGLIVGAFLFAMSLLTGLFLILGGRELQKSGTKRERSAHEQAVFAIARQRGGSVTPAELARSVSISESEADAFLTGMAKRPDGRVRLEVDDDGTLRYEVHEGGRMRVSGGARVRVSPGAATGSSFDADQLAEAEIAAEEEARQKGQARR